MHYDKYAACRRLFTIARHNADYARKQKTGFFRRVSGVFAHLEPVGLGGGREPVGKTQVWEGRAQHASDSEHANGRTTPPAEIGSWRIFGGFKSYPPKMCHDPPTHMSGNHCSAIAFAIPGNVLERFFALRELYTHDFRPVAHSVGKSGGRPRNHRSVRF